MTKKIERNKINDLSSSEMLSIFANLTFINDQIWDPLTWHDKYKLWFMCDAQQKPYFSTYQKFIIWNQMMFHTYRFWGIERKLDDAKPSFPRR